MRVLLIHPSGLMYSEIFLRLEPLGVERVAAAARGAGHEVRLLDLQVCGRDAVAAELASFGPDAVGFGVNYLASVPEVIELAQLVKQARPGCFVFAGGHSVSFIASHVLGQAGGAIDAVVRGEGEVITPLLLAAARDGGLADLPGVVTAEGSGTGAPLLLESLDDCPPARDLTRRRDKYFIGVLDPCASVEFTRGCPWDCSFCSAWTFYGRTYRKASPEAAAAEVASIAEPNVFIVDDVAFIRAEHGHAIAAELERRRVRKEYYLETRADVLLRNREVFERWRRLGLNYMFLGIEALDESGLDSYRKRVSTDDNLRALEAARQLGLTVAVNLIVDPAWDTRQFRLVREFAESVPEIVHLSVMTPYPGTEIWHTQSQQLTTRDYRLFDIQHAVLPTKLPLAEFYQELVRTQSVINRKHLGLAGLAKTAGIAGRLLTRGQTNFVRMLWRFSWVYNGNRQYQDHQREAGYELPVPDHHAVGPAGRRELYIHQRQPAARGRRPAERGVAAAATADEPAPFQGGDRASTGE
ncbi:MAG: hopanoid C-3 methylase HpnR [Nocardiopsaceae bacterium]|nr:hopanoid C-3 methylase HpnR [Nocardiopsaceae bacterium]